MPLRAIVFAAAAVVLTAAIARADSSQGVPPGVARISVVQNGELVLTRSDKAKTQVVGGVNMPIFAGDSVASTDEDTLAELQIDGYTALRLSGDVQLRLVANDAKMREIDMAQGLVELAVLHTDEGVSEVVTPNAVVRAAKPGNFRIWVSSDGETSVTARRGEVDLVTPHGALQVADGKTILVRGYADNPSLQSVDRVATDSFDDFNHERDRAQFAALNENTHVPSDIAAYDNLDQYGHWASVAPYGESWIPNHGDNWAPYRDGNWVWGSSYGWTWVGNEPWGWLPYHYGSWFYSNRVGWCWYPPAFGIVPVWVPAFVAFFGYGGGAYGYPYYGWVPLAPYETFYPWYPWYWGYYYPWSRWHATYPAPPPPPSRHQHGPIRMHPITTKYRNALVGGASTFDSRNPRDGVKMAPIRFDPVRFKNVTIREERQPIALPVDRSPQQPVHLIPSRHSGEGDHTVQSRAPISSLAPVAPYFPGSYGAPRGSATAPLQLHAPVTTMPGAPTERAPTERAPSAPVLHGSAPGSSHGGNGTGGSNGGGNPSGGNGGGNGGGGGSGGNGGGSRLPP